MAHDQEKPKEPVDLIDPSFTAAPISSFEEWLSERAARLPELGSALLATLRKDL
jgi:hypothetical protein